jgi:hypothetical protein
VATQTYAASRPLVQCVVLALCGRYDWVNPSQWHHRSAYHRIIECENLNASDRMHLTFRSHLRGRTRSTAQSRIGRGAGLSCCNRSANAISRFVSSRSKGTGLRTEYDYDFNSGTMDLAIRVHRFISLHQVRHGPIPDRKSLKIPKCGKMSEQSSQRKTSPLSCSDLEIKGVHLTHGPCPTCVGQLRAMRIYLSRTLICSLALLQAVPDCTRAAIEETRFERQIRLGFGAIPSQHVRTSAGFCCRRERL